MIQINNIQIQKPYTLIIEFVNNVRGSIDISKLFHKQKFAELQKWDLFSKVFIDSELWVPTRPNWADICTDYYYDLFSKNENASYK